MSAEQLVRVAERANAQRTSLLVSTVLGKHLPVDPARCRLAGFALALRAAEDPRAAHALAALLSGASVSQLVEELGSAPAAALKDCSVVGFAETATALGEQVATMLDAAWWQTTTRQTNGLRQLCFSETHSHAPNQLLTVPADGWPPGPLVIVDDELTTGRTAAALIRVLHAEQPRESYLVAALVDGRPPGDGPLEEVVEELAVSVRVSSLARLAQEPRLAGGWSKGTLPASRSGGEPVEIEDVNLEYRGPLQHEGQNRGQRRSLMQLAHSAATILDSRGLDTLMLGCGEHISFAQICALRAGARLTSSSTRSPILVARLAGYPIINGLSFANAEDPQVLGYAYNVVRAQARPLVVHFQDSTHRKNGQEMLEVLAGASASPIVAVTLAP